MAFHHRLIFAMFLAASLAAGAQNAQTNSQIEDQPPATIEGAVINTQNNRSVPRASVTLLGLQGAGSRSVRADGEGHFLFENVQPGKYKLSAERQGFFSDGKKQDLPTLQISPGQHLKNVPLRLIPTAVVAGEIVDEFNDPVQDVEVKLLVMKMRLGSTYLAPAGKALTDDRGQYRVTGLRPGKYYVLAEYKAAASQLETQRTIIPVKPFDGPANRAISPGGPTAIDVETPEESVEPAFTYAPTFFPETSDFQQAQTFRLKPGDEIPADFILISTPVVSIRGRVRNGMTSETAINASVSALWSEYMEGEGIPAKVSEKGDFEIRGLATGTYTVRASFTEGGQSYQGEQNVVVGIRGAQNVVIDAMPDFTAAGHVNITANVTQTGRPITRVNIEFAGEGLIPRVRSSAGLPAMKFNVQLRPDHRYHAIVRNLPEDYYLKSVTVLGHQMEPDNVIVSGAGGDMEIELSPAGGHIDGVLLDSKGQPARGSILLVPDRPDPGPTDLFRRASAGDKGAFSIRGVTPGSYLAIAMQSSDLDTEINTPEFFSTVRNRGQSVVVDENGRYSITVSLANAESVD